MTVAYRGRQVDGVALWSEYVEFPHNFIDNGKNEFAPLVRCPNPDHHTEKRHFQVNLFQPTVHCFANCGISGSYERAIAMIEGVTHRQARKSILRHSRLGGGNPVRKRHRGGTVETISPGTLEYERFLPHAALAFLASRNLSPEIIAKFELGWDADALRVVIPVKDRRGRVRLLIRRTIRPKVEPRYLYTEGVERNSLLFGLDTIDPGTVRLDGMVLVEGSIDKMVLDSYSIPPSVAILGSKLSEIQARIICKARPSVIYTMFDADAAGIGATISVAQRIRGIPIRVCRYPKGKTDPAVLNEKEAMRSIARAMPYVTFRSIAGISTPKQSTRKENFG